MDEKGNENLSDIEINNDINIGLDNKVYEPSTPVILEPPRKEEVTEDNTKKNMFKHTKINKEKINKTNDIDKKDKDKKQLENKPEKQTDEIINLEKIELERNSEIYQKNETNKYLIILISLFAVLLIIFTIYYYLVMTPTKVFDDTINTIFANIKTKMNDYKNKNFDTAKISLNSQIKTNSINFQELNDLNINTNFDINLKNGNINTQFNVLRYNNSLFNTKLYIKDGFTYLDFPKIDEETENNKIIKYDFLNIKSNNNLLEYDDRKLTSLYNILEETKDNILNIIDEKKLKRTIVMKNINDTTTIALKVNCELNKTDISNIYYQVFNKYINDDAIIKEIEIMTGYDKETIINILNKLIYREVSVENINVDLYTNLANTNLVSLDINIDNHYFIEINNLSGYYKFKITKKENDLEVLNISGKYNIDKKELNGEIIIENNKTYSKIKYNYKNSQLNLEYYNNTSDTPQIYINNIITIKENTNIDKMNESNIYTLEENENYPILNNDEFMILEERKNKINEKYNFIKNIILNNKMINY